MDKFNKQLYNGVAIYLFILYLLKWWNNFQAAIQITFNNMDLVIK